MTAPERIWAYSDGLWIEAWDAPPSGAEYIRADLAAVPAQVRVRPTDAQINSACLSYRHDFGLRDKRDQDNLRFQANEWLIAWQKEARILAAIDVQPDPRDAQIAALVEALHHAQYGLSWAVRYFKDQDVTKYDPCPPCTRGLSATRAALDAVKRNT